MKFTRLYMNVPPTKTLPDTLSFLKRELSWVEKFSDVKFREESTRAIKKTIDYLSKLKKIPRKGLEIACNVESTSLTFVKSSPSDKMVFIYKCCEEVV